MSALALVELSPAESRLTILGQAQKCFAEIVCIETDIQRSYDRLLVQSWLLGKALSALKADIGHSRWLYWLGANWSELGERRAQRVMALFNANPSLSNPSNLTDFSVDSIRAFLGGYIPAKIRPQLPGDQKLNHGPNQWNFVNDLNKFHQQISKGLIPRPSVEDAQRQLGPSLDVMLDLAGPEWVIERAKGKI